MPNEVITQTSDTGKIQIATLASQPPILSVDRSTIANTTPDVVVESATTINENAINNARMKVLQQQFTRQLISLIAEEDFEYGIENKIDILVRAQLKLNKLATKSWLNSLYIDYIHDVNTIFGVLRVIARLDYDEISPEGPVMAIASLSHRNPEIQECGIRAFESWRNRESINILKNVQPSAVWLKEYLDQVIQELEKEHYDIAN